MSETAPLLSIIVPVYNVERYLRQCLNSVLSQTLTDIEIICVDDGSTDSSPEIISEYMKADSRVRVVTKANSGYGDSMNRGLDAARGEYVGIVESDDWVDPEMFDDLTRLARRERAEVVKSNFYHYVTNGDISIKFNLIDPAHAFQLTYPLADHYVFFQMAAIWAAVYRRDFLVRNEIRFLPTAGASYQDTSFNFKVWACARRVYFTSEAYLHYRIDNQSSSINSKDKIFCVMDELHEIDRFVADKNLEKDLKGVVVQRKVDIYSWNLTRLRGEDATSFAKAVSDEFRQADAKGDVDYAILSPAFAQIFRQLRDDPVGYVDPSASGGIVAKARHVATALRPRVGRVVRGSLMRIDPSYRSRVRLGDQLEEVIWRNDQFLSELRRVHDAGTSRKVGVGDE